MKLSDFTPGLDKVLPALAVASMCAALTASYFSGRAHGALAKEKETAKAIEVLRTNNNTLTGNLQSCSIKLGEQSLAVTGLKTASDKAAADAAANMKAAIREANSLLSRSKRIADMQPGDDACASTQKMIQEYLK